MSVAYNSENLAALQTSKAQVLALIQEVTAEPKPSYTVDGVTFNFTEYLTMLLEKVDTLSNLILRENSINTLPQAVKMHPAFRNEPRSPYVGRR